MTWLAEVLHQQSIKSKSMFSLSKSLFCDWKYVYFNWGFFSM